MASTFSTNLKIELQTTGENSGTWGTITNTNLGTALEQAIVGYGNPSYASDANLTLTYTDTNAAQTARALVLNVTSAVSLTGTRELVVPTIQKQYIVQNNTTGSQSITVKTSGGTGVTVPNGRKAHLYVNGTDVIYMDDYVDINGGAIDGTPIGANSASTGAFTTLAASGNVTLSGGTANGVLYLNGSKVATSGTALVFDGTNLGVGTASPTAGYRGQFDGDSAAAAISVGVRNTNTTGVSRLVLGNNIGQARFTFGYTGSTASAPFGASLGYLGTEGSEPVVFQTNGTERMRLDSSGNLSVTSGNLSIASGSVFYLSGSGGNVYLQETGGTLFLGAGGAARVQVISSGNLGIGVTPSASNACTNIELPYGATLSARSNTTAPQFAMMSNAVGNWYEATYKINGFATQYTQQGFTGTHAWYNAPSGTAGNPISFTQAMTLDASGRLLVGRTTSDANGYLTQVLGTSGYQAGLLLTYSGVGSGAIFENSSGALVFGNDNASGTTERARIDSSGNVGIGVTPSAWVTTNGYRAMQIGGVGIYGRDAAANELYLTSNAFNSATGFKYIYTAAATQYAQLSGSHVWYNAASGTADNPITFTQAMTLTAAGNLGIGSTSPSQRLTVAGSIQMDGSGTFYLNNSDNTNQYYWQNIGASGANNATLILSRTNVGETLRIDSSGNLGIGTASPSAFGLLAVVKDQTADTAIVVSNGGTSNAATTMSFALSESGAKQGWFRRYRDGSASTEIGFSDALLFTGNVTGTKAERGRFTAGGELLVGTTSNSPSGTATKFVVEYSGGSSWGANFNQTVSSATYYTQIAFSTAGALVGEIRSNNAATQYNTSSDRRLKDNIAPADDAGSVVDAIEIVKHDWKVGGSVRYGVIAQDLHKVAPEAVSAGDDGEEIEKTWGVDYSKLVPMLVKEVQSLRKRVAELEAK